MDRAAVLNCTVFNNSGRILTIRATPMEKSRKIRILKP